MNTRQIQRQARERLNVTGGIKSDRDMFLEMFERNEKNLGKNIIDVLSKRGIPLKKSSFYLGGPEIIGSKKDWGVGIECNVDLDESKFPQPFKNTILGLEIDLVMDEYDGGVYLAAELNLSFTAKGNSFSTSKFKNTNPALGGFEGLLDGKFNLSKVKWFK